MQFVLKYSLLEIHFVTVQLVSNAFCAALQRVSNACCVTPCKQIILKENVTRSLSLVSKMGLKVGQFSFLNLQFNKMQVIY